VPSTVFDALGQDYVYPGPVLRPEPTFRRRRFLPGRNEFSERLHRAKQSPRVELNVEAQSTQNLTTVTVSNPTRSLAFAVHLKLRRWAGGAGRRRSDNEEVLPVLWQVNYFPLLPGESRRVSATSNTEDRGGEIQWSKSREGM
jgi:hypothetical protein